MQNFEAGLSSNHPPTLVIVMSITTLQMPPVAERLRQAYPALLERAGVGSIPANSDAQNVPSFCRWRFEMKLSPVATLQGL